MRVILQGGNSRDLRSLWQPTWYYRRFVSWRELTARQNMYEVTADGYDYLRFDFLSNDTKQANGRVWRVRVLRKQSHTFHLAANCQLRVHQPSTGGGWKRAAAFPALTTMLLGAVRSRCEVARYQKIDSSLIQVTPISATFVKRPGSE